MKRAFCCLALIVMAVACKRQPSPTIFLDPGLATLVPSDTVFLAGARIEQLHPTPLYKQYVLEGQFAWAEQFRKDTGLDIRKDIWEIVVPLNGKQAVALLRGKFSDMGQEPNLAREGAKRFGYKGLTLIGDEKTAAAFLNPTTAIAGSTAMVRHVIDERNTKGGVPGWLSEQIKEIPSSNQVWFAGNLMVTQFSRSEGSSSPADMLLQLGKAVKTVRGGADLRAGFRGHASATADSPENAKRLRDGVRALLGFARLNTSTDQQQMLSLYDSVQVQNQAQNVDVTADVPQQQVESLIQLLRRMDPSGR